MFSSPTAAIFAIVLVCGAFIGASVVNSGAPLGTPDVVSSGNNGESEFNAAAAAAIAAELILETDINMAEPIETKLMLFLTPFKDTTTPDLLARAYGGIKAVVDSGDNQDLADVLAVIDVKKNTDLAAGVKEMDAKDDPTWMESIMVGGEGGEGGRKDLSSNKASLY